MNETGLSLSMQPSLTSVLFETTKQNQSWVQKCLPCFPSSNSFFKKNKINYIFNVSPLTAKAHLECGNKNKTLQRCSKCQAFPSFYCTFTNNKWICAVCRTKNAIRAQTFLSRQMNYDIIIGEEEKPLFLFVFQENNFIQDNEIKTMIGNALENWAKNTNTNVTLVIIGEKITYFDLKTPRAFTYFDVDIPPLPICNSMDAKFSASFSSFCNSTKHTSGTEFYINLVQLMKSIHQQNVCLSIFSTDIQSSSDIEKEFKNILSSRRFSIHLFTSKNADCASFAKYCFRIRLFESNSFHLVAPELYQFLTSGILFSPNMKVFVPPCLSVCQISSRRNMETDKITLSSIDGQSSIIVDAYSLSPPSSPSLVFQISIFGIREDGEKILRVLNFETHTSIDINKFDGTVFGCYLARLCAVDSYYISYEEAFKNTRERFIDLISAWSSKGHYRRSIPSMFRDVPLLMYAIQNSNIFKNSSTAIEKIATTINLMCLSIEYMTRLLYPIMITLPLEFPNRLTKKTIGAFKFFVFIREFDGIALILDELNHDQEIQDLSIKYNVPITKCYDEKNLKAFLIEDFPNNDESKFVYFTENLEVEVNGRRF